MNKYFKSVDSKIKKFLFFTRTSRTLEKSTQQKKKLELLEKIL